MGPSSGERSTRRRPPDLVWWCVLALTALAPPAMSNFTWLGVLPGLTADQFDIVKISLIRGIVLLALAAWLWRLLLRGGRIRRTRVDWLVVGFIGWALVTTALSIHPATAVLGSYRRYEGFLTLAAYGLVFFLAVQTVDSPGRRRELAWVFSLSATLVGAYGVAQYLGWDPALWGTQAFEGNGAFSTFGNPNLLGGFLVLALPVSVALALTEQHRAWRAGAWTSVLALAAAWVMTFTRGAWVAGVVALLVMAYAGTRQRVKLRPIDWGFAVAGLAAVAAVVARSLSSAFVATNAWERVRTVFDLSQGSGRTRTLIWRSALDAIGDRPLAGSGPDTFRLVFPAYQTADYPAAAGYDSIADTAHNYILQLAATLGLPGALLFVVIFAGSLWLAAPRDLGPERGSAHIGSRDPLLLAGFWAAALGYSVHLFFGVSVSGSSVFLWMFLGVLLVPWSWSRRVEAPRWGRAAAVPALAVVGVALLGTASVFLADYYYGRTYADNTSADRVAAVEQAIRFNPYSDEYRTAMAVRHRVVMEEWLRQAQAERAQGLDPAASLSRAKQEFENAVTAARDAMDRSPRAYDNYLLLSQLYNGWAGFDAALYAQAEDVAAPGAELAPTSPTIWVQLGIAYAGQGRYGEAEEAAQRAAALDPLYVEPLVLLGDIYRLWERPDDARRAYGGALTLDPGNLQAQQGLAELERAPSPE